MNVEAISPGNKALIYLQSRIKSPRYRGTHLSQHNRYNMDQLFTILTLLDKYAPNTSLFQIRTTDISKRPESKPGEEEYARFCDDVKKETKIGSQDAMRKNLFLDLHRMGFIDRFDAHKRHTDPFSRSPRKYVALTKQGVKFINSPIRDRYFIYSRGIDKLVGGQISTLLEIFSNADYKIKFLNIHEYMFYVSAIGIDAPFATTIPGAIDLISSSRLLTTTQHKALVATLKDQLRPNNFSGTKVSKRDYHNWRNEASQIYSLLGQTVYFEVRGEKLILATSKPNLDGSELRRLERSLSEKFEYFKQHKVQKISGFELHHVVPLAWSESIEHFKILDRWMNMLYIDAYSHAKITQNGSRNVRLSFLGADISLSDFSANEVMLLYPENVAYSPKLKGVLGDYNVELLSK